MFASLRTIQRALTPESLISSISTQASSPEHLSYPPTDYHESSDSLLLEPLTISDPRPLRGPPVSVSDSSSSTLFSDNGLYESPFTDSPHHSIASTPPSPQRSRLVLLRLKLLEPQQHYSRCTIPLPDTTEKKLYALNATEAAMTGNECQSNGTKEDTDDNIRKYLRGYKKKRHTPSGLPEVPADNNMSTDSDPPSYRTRRTSDPNHPGDGWERYGWPEMVNIDMQIPDGLGNITLPKYVKYDLMPSYPTRCVPLAKVKDLTPTQLHLFNQTEPFLNWVEEALDSEAD
ncbi:hypothetical protein BJV77DRAFT_1073865 [Russula vinacea]|nr:hypothetical protein BJV77DRAFT_1073865 [Russula vinacea]